MSLRRRLSRYLSPPLFPVRMRDLPCQLSVHELTRDTITIGGVQVAADRVCHPDPTLGYRLEEPGASLTYMPDHEPALGAQTFPGDPVWTSGYDLAAGVDVLIHDTHFTEAEYPQHVGWGHCTMHQAVQFATLAGVSRLIAFHHHPARDDAGVEDAVAAAVKDLRPTFPVTPAHEGMTLAW